MSSSGHPGHMSRSNSACNSVPTQEPAAVPMTDSSATDAQQKGVSFQEKSPTSPASPTSQTRSRWKDPNTFFGKLGHELSHDSITEKEMMMAETRPVPHRYVFQRPRALQYTYRGERIEYGEDANPITHEISGASDLKYTAEGVSKSRERIDLFIDLVWVGIISNLSEVYSTVYFQLESSSGKAFLMFILVFLPAFRVWNFLREFLNSFYMDDMIQRVFIFWILGLSLYFGNEIAYFAEDYENVKEKLIIAYVTIRGSFVLMEMFYAIWIPWMRRLICAGFLIMLPSSGLWIAAIWCEGEKAIGPALAAIGWEYLIPHFLDSPLADKLLPSEYRRDIDPVHLRSRMGSFLIITIGEGVLLMIKGGPLGQDTSDALGYALVSLSIYFLLAYIYFQRDGSTRYIPAARHRGWRSMIWMSLHVPIFASFITLAASILWFINRNTNVPIDGEGETTELTEEEFVILRARAIWNIAGSLSIITFGYWSMALLDKPLDGPRTLLVNNRWLRLAGRPIYIIVLMTVPLTPNLTGFTYLTIASVGLALIMWWELNSSLERPARLIEPRGLTVLMKREYRQERPSDAGLQPAVRIAI